MVHDSATASPTLAWHERMVVVAVTAVTALAAAGCSRQEAFSGGDTASAASASATSSATASAASARPVASHVPPHVEAANVTQASATVDGLLMEKISCRSKAPLEGKESILRALAQQHTELDKCTEEQRTLRVHFAFDGGKTGDVRVKEAASAELRRCVGRAIQAATFPGTGACALSLTIGG